MEFGHDLHAGRERVAAAVGIEVFALEIDQRAEGQRRGGTVAPGERSRARIGVGRLGGVGADLRDAALRHAVFLKLECRELQLRFLPRVHETDVVVREPHLRTQALARGHQRHEDRARRDHRSRRVRGEVFHDARLRCAQLEQCAAVRLLGEFLPQALRLGRDLGALGLQLPAVVGTDLGDALLGLGDRGARAGDEEFLALQVLLPFDQFALLVRVEQLAGKSVARQLGESALLLAVVRQHLQQLRFHFHGGGEVVPRALEDAALLRQRVLMGAHIGSVLRFGLRESLGRIVVLAPHRLAGKLRFDAAQCEAPREMIGRQRARLGFQRHRIHAREHLAGAHRLAFAHGDFLDDALFRRLNDLEVTGGHELSFGDRDDVEPRERRPRERGGDQ